MTVIVVTIAVPVVALLLYAWHLDRKAQRRGERLRTTEQMIKDTNNIRRDVHAWDRMQNLGRDGLPPRR